MSNVLSISAIELVEKLKSGEISCVDACKEYIKRIDKFDKEVKAWAFFDKKLLLEKAEERDEYRKSGKPLGPLHQLNLLILTQERQLILMINQEPLEDLQVVQRLQLQHT